MELKSIIPIAALTLTLGACNNIVNYDDDYTPADQLANTGAPVITAVYDVADTAMSTPITEGSLGQMVRIVGQNLNGVRRITFNTVEADISETYTFGTSANVLIPSKLSLNHENKIVYTTDMGSAAFDFVIPFPALTVTGLVNEFANAGDPVTVTGSNFDLYDFGTTSKVYLGSTELAVSNVTATTMQVQIPEGTADNSTITLAWSDANGQALTADQPFRPTTHLLYPDLGSISTSLSGEVGVTIEGDDAVSTGASSLGCPHLHFSGSLGAWSWNTFDLSCNMIDAGDLTSLNDYVLKFEVLTAPSFPLTESSPLQWCFNWGDSYTWNPGSLNTKGLWQTVALPLASMATNGISATGTWQTLRIIFQPTAAYEADFRIGNIRIEKK